MIRIRPNLAIATIMTMIAASPIYAVGTVNQVISPIGRDPGSNPDNRVHQLAINWTADASVGTVPVTTIALGAFPAIQGMRLVSVEIKPGTPAPTNLYSITLTDSLGIDLLSGTGLSLSNTTATSTTITNLAAPVFGGLTFTLTNNSVNSATGTVYAFFAPLTQTTITSGSPTLTGSNTFTGTNTFTGPLNCKNFENVRCVDASNAAGWAGTTGDAWITAAIADLVANSPTKAGEVWVAPGVYSVANTIRISTSDVKLKCLGISHSFNTGGPSCTLNWTGAAAGTMILVDTVNTSALTGVSIYGFFLNGQGANAAATGLSILSSQQGEYEQIDLSGGFTAQSILLSIDPAVTNPATGSGTAQNWFRNVNVLGGAANAHGWNLTGSSNQDVFMNTFHIITSVASGTGDAYHLENADNNRFFSINATEATGFGLHLTCMASAASQNMCARENEFFNSNLGSNPIKQDGVSTFYATSNRIYGYETCNGSALPTTSVILKGSLQVDSLDCGDTAFSSLYFSVGAAGTSFLSDNFNYKTGHTISNPVNYTSHIFDSSAGSVNKFMQWNDNGTNEWVCGLVGASEQWKCADSVNGIDRLVLGKSGGSNANIYNVPTGLVHAFQVNSSNAAIISSTNITPGTAGTLDVGSTSLPFGNLWLGSSSTSQFKFAPAATAASRTITIPDPGGNANLTLTPCITSQRTESAADANLLTCAIPAAAGSYRIRFVLSISAANAATLGWTATWHDANGGGQAPANLAAYQPGVGTPALTFTTSAAGDIYGSMDLDVDNSATSIVVKLTFSGTSFTAKATATVERIV